jgi:hypothetical protein
MQWHGTAYFKYEPVTCLSFSARALCQLQLRFFYLDRFRDIVFTGIPSGQRVCLYVLPNGTGCIQICSGYSLGAAGLLMTVGCHFCRVVYHVDAANQAIPLRRRVIAAGKHRRLVLCKIMTLYILRNAYYL